MSILQRLRRWSFTKLVLVCIGWLVVSLAWPLIAIAVTTIFVMLQSVRGGSGGVGAVSAGCLEVPLVFFPPVIVLITLWIVAKRTAVVDPAPTRSGPSPDANGESR